MANVSALVQNSNHITVITSSQDIEIIVSRQDFEFKHLNGDLTAEDVLIEDKETEEEEE